MHLSTCKAAGYFALFGLGFVWFCSFFLFCFVFFIHKKEDTIDVCNVLTHLLKNVKDVALYGMEVQL